MMYTLGGYDSEMAALVKDFDQLFQFYGGDWACDAEYDFIFVFLWLWLYKLHIIYHYSNHTCS